MKAIRRLLVIACIAMVQQLTGQEPSVTDYVSVQGDKLYCKGQQFFAVMVNYQPLIADNGPGWMICPEGIAPWENPTYEDLVASFQDIRQKGFNSIRLLGLNVGVHCASFTPDPITGCNQCTETTTFQYRRYPDDGLDGDYWTRYEDLDPAPHSEFFSMLDFVLDAAAEADLKVMLLVGKQASNDGSMTDFNNYLGALVEHLKNNPTVFAYDLTNEPYFNDDDCHTKQEICEIVNTWTSIVHAHSRQLTTLDSYPNQLHWDAGVMNVDFFSPHMYTISKMNLVQYDFDRAMNIMWWYKLQNFGIPWIIGETAVSADINDGNTTTDECQIGDMEDYIIQTLNYCRDAGGSGYAWWSLYDGLPDIDPPIDLTVYYGLKTTDGTWKSVTEGFENFTLYPQGTATEPPSYFEPFGVLAYSIHGTVTDQNNQPVPNATIYHSGSGESRTYTRADGTYTLYSPVTFSTSAVFLSAPGYSIGTGSGYSNGATVNFQLETVPPPDNDLTINGVTIPEPVTLNIQAIQTIETNMVVQGSGTTGATCNLKAMQSITLTNGYHADKGSSAHIYLERVMIECSDLSGLEGASDDRVISPLTPEPPEATVSGAYKLYPNPAQNVFTIEKSTDSFATIEVMNAVGQIVLMPVMFTDRITTVNLSGQAEGVYFVRIISGGETEIIRLVKME